MEKINDLKHKKVFITGANGFVSTHCIKQLLNNDISIVGSVRSLQNVSNQELFEIVPEKKNLLKLVEIDLSASIEDWRKAMEGCDYLFHIASPVFVTPPKDENEVLKPAVDGTRNVLEAAVLSKLKKVVVMSSGVTSIFKLKDNHFFESEDYSDEKLCNLYAKSKLLAEKEAISLAEKYKGRLNLSIIRPFGVLDECLTSQKSLSNLILKVIFNSPILIDMGLPIVSAHDVALASLRCIQYPETSRNKKYFLWENTYSVKDIVYILKEEFEKYGYFIKKVYIPTCVFWLPSKFSQNINFLYQKFKFLEIMDNDPVKEDLKMGFENHRKVILRTFYSMINRNEIRNKIK